MGDRPRAGGRLSLRLGFSLGDLGLRLRLCLRLRLNSSLRGVGVGRIRTGGVRPAAGASQPGSRGRPSPSTRGVMMGASMLRVLSLVLVVVVGGGLGSRGRARRRDKWWMRVGRSVLVRVGRAEVEYAQIVGGGNVADLRREQIFPEAGRRAEYEMH